MKRYSSLILFLFLQPFCLFAQETWNLLWTKDHNCDHVYTASFNFDGSKVVSVSCDKTVKIWNATNGDLLWTVNHSGAVGGCFSPDGSKVVSVSDDNSVKLWDTNSGSLIWTANHTGSVTSAVFTPEGKTIVTGGYDDAIRAWNANNGQQIWSYQFDFADDDVLAVNVSPDGSKIIAGTNYNKVVVLNANTGSLLWTGKHNGEAFNRRVCSVSFSPDGTKAVSGSWDNTVKVWDSTTGTVLWTGPHTNDVNSVCFCHDGTKIVSASSDKTIIVWNSADGKVLWTGNHTDVVNAVNFNPDGSCVISGSKDKTVKIWNSATGTLLWSGSTSPAREAQTVCFSSDGKKIVSGGAYSVTAWKSVPTSIPIFPPEPLTFKLMQNYPNPFNLSTTINYELPENSDVVLKIYDVLGREIQTLVNNKESADIHEITLNGAGLLSGIYYCKIQAGKNFTQTRKMILKK
jgi:WD40 repeat protein